MTIEEVAHFLDVGGCFWLVLHPEMLGLGNVLIARLDEILQMH